MKKIKMAEMYVDDDIKKAIIDTLDSGRYIKGQQNKNLEKEFAKFCGTKYAVTVNSGTSALILALRSLGLNQDDEVILPSHTFVATANAVVHAGAKPIFAEIDEKTYTIDPQDVKNRITKYTKVIMPVHLYGHPADMLPLKELAEENDLLLIEDCCQAHGATYNNKKVGSIGHASTFSFFPSKNMTVCGDGGAVTTNDSEIAEKVSMLADQGRKKGEKYRHDLVGYNFRMSEIHAAIGREQLKHLPEWIKNRRKNAGYYTKLLSDIEGVVTPSEKKWAKHVYHLYVIRTEQRDELKEYLKKQGISTGIHYPVPVHRQPCITQLIKPTTLFVTDKIADEVLSLPMHPQLKFNDIEFIVKKISEFYG